MNLAFEKYRAGWGTYVGHIFIPGGRRVAVFDRQRRARAAIAALGARGMGERDIARALRRPRSFVRAELARKNWKQTYFMLHKLEKFPIQPEAPSRGARIAID